MILIIDNYDSFTYNLARYFEELGRKVKVVKNDEVDIDDLNKLNFTHLVLSPGPCTPNESGICLQAIIRLAGKVPMLGVCLGHQAIAQVFGAKIVRAANILHGKTATLQVIDAQSKLFEDCPKQFVITRYHSLIIDEDTLPSGFTTSAICETQGVREIMAIENPTLQLYGVQFHPESLLTEYGHKILSNFIDRG